MRKFARLVVMLIVAVTSVMAIANIPDELRHLGGTAWQQSVQFGGALHGVLGALLVLGMWRRRPWAVPVAVAWTVAVVYTACVATLAWEEHIEQGAMAGTLAAGISCALIGWWAVWAARESVRPHIPATASATPDR